jgi:hypothetical protein
MSNTIRIRTTPNGGDKYIKLNLEQDFDSIEILSLKISQEDAYRKFCSDYGVVVGRVSINNGFGVPNAKVSIFIPLDDVDAQDPLISGLYPFEVISDKDSDGIRYNLLPTTSETDNDCYTPVGTFPTKREILDNDTMLQVYCKYYKFTTTTNHAGDFMFFGVPLGSHVVHVDADISDIGIASQRPYDFISQGTPAKLFDSPNRFKSSKNLNSLIQVKTLNAGVNVQPFWGDPENCQIGITRIDFDLNTNIVPAAIFMGSIYGDQHKHSINKRCRPRKALGNMCDQVTGPGSINMIRKTLDGQIEDFSVEGGQLIDDDGTWAFQVPCNLDYMLTAEDGSLIFSQDPNMGVPTRARVRFDIGMDETGGEGRLRTRARYLVPNNPTNVGEVDYTFGDSTKDSSFKDLYWNKIYTVTNFISRFQRNTNINKVGSRSITGLKNVDACAGDKTPFPFNKVDTELNPIFVIICLIIKIVGFIIYIVNALLIPLINAIISAINAVMNAIVGVVCGINSISSFFGLTLTCGLSWTNINPVGCLTVTCPSDDGQAYAPGCSSGTDGFNAASITPVYYPGDSFGHGTNFGNLVGLDDCIAFEMAESLDLFKFDFYNDWVNGSLFGFLLKYKKKSSKREIFCEYECTGSGTFTAIDGVDGNQNGVGDNDCHDNLLLDTCYHGVSISNPTGNDQQKEARDSGIIREGLIKKVGNNFYYAATTHNLAFKLFATDIVELGAVFNCDWQGIPKIQPMLTPTTYKIPPDTQELNDTNTISETCGMVGIGGNTSGEFFSIDCLGIHVDDRQCLNIRHICEMGVEIDQAKEDPLTGAIIVPSDCILGPDDIDDASGKWFRDVFTALNSASTTTTTFNIGGGLSTNFNTSTLGTWYNFTSYADNGQDYVNFRGYALNDDNNFRQPKHSYFFYFGLNPGKTAVEKMNSRFFTHCTPATRDDIIIESSSTIASGNTGTITFSFFGGTGPFTYTITGSIPNSSGGTTPYGPITGSSTGATITGLAAGTYTITALDALGTPVSTTIIVSAQPPLYASAGKTQDCSTSTSNDGVITISSVGGGVPPYQFQLTTGSGAVVPGYGFQSLSTPDLLNGLSVDNLVGYTVTVVDSAANSVVITGITIGGPNMLVMSATSVNVQCYGENNGSISLMATGGLPPKTFLTTGPAGFTSSSINLTTLYAGTYVSTVTDGGGASTSLTSIITQPLQLVISSIVPTEVGMQCDPNFYYVPFHIDGVTSGIAPGLVNVYYSIDGGAFILTAMTYTNITTPMIITVGNTSLNVNIRIKFKEIQGGNICYSNTINILKTQMTLPPAFLTASLGTVPNNCAPNTSSFNLNISHNVRAPYTINYNIGSGALVGSTTTSSLTTLMSITGIPSSNKFPNQISMVVTVTDDKGCVSPPLLLTSPSMLQQVPAAALTCNVVTGAMITSGPNAGKYPHVVTATGGITPYVGTGTFYDTNTTYTATITDANGCMSTATG